LITIEVECLLGLVDFFLSFRKVPCVSDFERHVTCTAKKDGKATLTFQPNPWKDGSYFIAVFSYYTDALFNIRAITTYDVVRSNPVLERVDKILRKLEILAAKDGTALQENYAKLEAEAKKMVEDEQYEPSAKTTDEQRVQSEASVYTSNCSSFVDNYDDTHSIGKFMVKIARYVLPPPENQDSSSGSDTLDAVGQPAPEEDDRGGHEYSLEEAAETDWQDDNDINMHAMGDHLSTVEESDEAEHSDHRGPHSNNTSNNQSGQSITMHNPSITLSSTSDLSGPNTNFIEVDTMRYSPSMPILNMFGQTMAVTAVRSPPPPETNSSKYLEMSTDQFDVPSSDLLLRSKSLIDIAKDYAQRERKFRSENASITIPIRGESVPLFVAAEKHRVKDPMLTQVIRPLKYSITRDYA